MEEVVKHEEGPLSPGGTTIMSALFARSLAVWSRRPF